MSVKRRLQAFSGFRFDVPHLRSLESSISFDFDSVLRGMVTGLDNPYLIRGFDVVIPNAAINASSLQVSVSDSAILHSTAAESGTILTVPAGTPVDTLSPSNPIVIGSFQNGVANYVSLSYVREVDSSTVDQVAGWSESQQSEFQRTAPIGRLLEYRYVISTSGFSTNLPLFIVGVSSTGAVEYITKSTPGLFRLGTGGTVPDPFYNFNFGGLVNAQDPTNPRREWFNESPGVTPNPVSVIPGDDVSAFAYGDWSIKNLKEWMDAIMTRIKEITGSSLWYVDTSIGTSPVNVADLWWDSVGSVMTGSGYMSYNLILEINQLTSGALQSQFTDNSILRGDSYVEGSLSGNKADLQAFYNTQLVINSLVRSDFIFDEPLYNRRFFRPAAAKFQLSDTVDGSFRKAIVTRKNFAAIGPSQSISSWSYVGNVITVTCPTHGFQVGDFVRINGLQTTTGVNVPNGVHFIKNVVDVNTFEYTPQFAPTGTTSVVAGTAQKDSSDRHPYMPRFAISSWSYVGTAITVTAQGHSLSTGDTIVINGLAASTDAPNGRFASIVVNPDRTISYTAPIAPTGTASITSGNTFARPDSYTFLLTISGAVPDAYDLTNAQAISWSDAEFSYVLGVAALPSPGPASGAIEFDGVVAITSVTNPAMVTSIVNLGAPNYDLLVTTASPHGFSLLSNISYTIYGNPALSPYIRTYQNVDLIPTMGDPYSFTLHPIPPNGTVIVPPPSSYINSGSDNTFARYPDNPYPGPIQWSSDMLVKGIIGDKFFRIPQTSIADGTPLANRFNQGGLTGTAFLQDGEVAYIILERNESVSSGSSYSSSGGATITGSTPPVDLLGSPLVAGDFIKFEGEAESRWLRIKGAYGTPIFSSIFDLESDNGQSPTISQRPAASGKIVYCKTTYNVVHVKPHWQVESDPNVYWLAVRRDNGGSVSKVYLKALELEQGEVRQINDNEMSNLLVYTGAGTEAAINPNYTQIDPAGPYKYLQSLTLGSNTEDIDVMTRTLRFEDQPELGFQAGDKLDIEISSVLYTFTIDFLYTSATIAVKEDVSMLSPSSVLRYYAVNKVIEDQDNLTLGIRKVDREEAKIETALSRPIYDESCFVQQINLNGAGVIRSGRYIYQGTADNPTALAWVLHGTASTAENIEGVPVSMPGGHTFYGSNAILVHMITGSFLDGTSILQHGLAPTTRTINNPGNPAFLAPTLIGGSSGNGVALVLPPNRRTKVYGTAYVIWPAMACYKASLDDDFAGEELLLIANDSIREANVDYEESFGGPKAQIQLLRDLPPNSRLRFRIMSAYGSALIKLSGSVSLQVAYNGGNIISSIAGLPVDLRAGDSATGGTALSTRGSIEVDGRSSTPGVILGGIFGPRSPNADQSFVVGNEVNKAKEVWTGSEMIKKHSGYTGSAWTRFTASGTSIGSGSTVIADAVVTIPTNKVARISINATARRTDGPLGGASFRIEGTFYNTGAGAAAAGSPATIHFGGFGDGNEYAIAFGTIGNDVVLVAFGSNGSTVQWVTGVDYQVIEDSI